MPIPTVPIDRGQSFVRGDRFLGRQDAIARIKQEVTFYLGLRRDHRTQAAVLVIQKKWIAGG